MKLLINTLHSIDFWNLPVNYANIVEKKYPFIKVVNLKHTSRLKEEIKDADIYFGWFPGREALNSAEKLKWMHLPQVGVGRVVSSGLKDIVVTNASEVDRRQIGEFAVSLFLSLYFSMPAIIDGYREKRWARKEIIDLLSNKNRIPLKKMTAVIFGFGGIGKVIAELMEGIVGEVIVVKRNPEHTGFKTYSIQQWREFLPLADAIFLAIPSNREGKGFLSSEKLELCVKKPYIVNVGRGKVVVEKDIAQALKNGLIKGYAADVCEKEPPDKDFPLWGFDNVIISPHVAAVEPDFWEKHFEFFLENLERFLKGEKLKGVVND